LVQARHIPAVSHYRYGARQANSKTAPRLPRGLLPQDRVRQSGAATDFDVPGWES
jgi:hypothetical protein